MRARRESRGSRGGVGVATLVLVSLLTSACAAAPADPASPTGRPAADGPGNVETPEAGTPAAASDAGARSDPSPAPPAALVIWARGDLPASFAAAVAELRGVVAAAHVRTATVGLVATRDGTGALLEQHVDGWRVPVAAAAVDPAAYAATVDDPDAREVVAALTPGSVLLSTTGATLRGVGAGGGVDLVGVAGLTVAGVVDDLVVGRAEVVLHEADAAAAGLPDDGTVFVRHDAAAGTAMAALIDEVEALVPPDVTARVVQVRSPDERRRAPLVLSLPQVKARFGEFAYRPRPGRRDVEIDPGFVAASIVTAEVPILGRVRCHRDVVDDLRAALAAIAATRPDALDASRYAGCFVPRRIAVDGDALSHHSWGIALDVNVDLSLPGGGAPPERVVVETFAEHGFRWGGDFLVPDNHHFEWVGADHLGERPAPVRGRSDGRADVPSG